MKARRTGRRNSRGNSGSSVVGAQVSMSDLDAMMGFGGAFHESEDDIVRRLMDRVHRGHPLRAIRPS